MPNNDCFICCLFGIAITGISVALLGVSNIWLTLLLICSVWCMSACVYYMCMDAARIQDHNKIYPFHNKISVTIV